MDYVQQVCGDLKSISKFLNKTDLNININEIEEKLLKISENDLNFGYIYRLIESDLDQLKSDPSLTAESKLWIKSIDLMLRSVVLLNNLEESELISTQNYFTIKLTVIKLISLTIIPFISQHFKEIQHLFLSVDTKSLPVLNSRQLFSRQFVYNLTKFLIRLLNSKSIISTIIIEDCLASIIASLMTVRHESDSDQEKQSIGDQLSQLISESNQIVVIRNLLLLSRCKAIKWSNNEISKCLSTCLISDCGLICLINSVVDCDQTSERQTTLNQRFQAIGTIVSALPQLGCSLRDYYQSIGNQVLALLMSTDPNLPRIGSMILMSLNNRNQKLTQELIIDKILNVFLIPQTISSLKLNNAIEIVYNLIINRFDVKTFVPIVSHLFYCRVIIEDSVSHYKTLLNEIIVEIFSSIKQSVYLLDKTLFNNNTLINIYEVCVSDGAIGLKFKESNDLSNDYHLSDGQEFSLKQIDSIVQFVIKLLEKMSETFKMDLFLILIERMTFNKPSLLTCSLVDSINDSVSQILINYTEKSIRFVINTFQRIAEQQSETIVTKSTDEDDESDTDNEFNDMKQNSLTICLQILKVLLNEKQKLKEKDIKQLKQLLPSMEAFSKNVCFDESLRKTATELKNQIELYENSFEFMKNADENNEFESSMAELNDNLMPVRAHALIRLKQLIYAKDKRLLENKKQLLNALKSCLNDSESYIYLSAVNTLSTLSILCTDEVLPILMQEFADSQRTVEERLKVGEVLVRLSKSIGDFGHYYSKQYMNCFLNGIKSSDAAIRISSLSNLGQFCSSLRFALKPFIVELMVCIESLLKTDDNIEVKRSAVMFLDLLLRGTDRDVFVEVVHKHLKVVYNILRQIYSTTIDDILQLHCQLAIDEIDRIVRQLFEPNDDLIKNIKVLSL